MIRILHVLDKISVDSGVSSVVMSYYKKLEHNKIIFDFMLNEDTDAETRAYLESRGSRIFIMPGLRLANLFKYIRKLKKFYKSHDYKIIHGHVANSAVFYLGLGKNAPYRIIHSHNTKAADLLWKRVRNWILTRFIRLTANKYIACSNVAAEFLFGKKNDAFILNNAVDINKFIFDIETRKSIRGKLKICAKFVIGHVGRFCKQKNHDFLIDVFNEVYKINNNIILILIGGGELYQDIIKKAERLGLKDAVLFLGLKDNVNEYMNAMDVFVLPSLFEGLPIVAVEAQVSGLPVFLSDKTTRETDITGENIFLSLEKELWIRELQKASLFDRVSAGNKAKGSRFDIDVQVKRLCNYYEELLKE